MLVVGIESTCDETALALVASGKEVLAHVVASQAALHGRFGGVVPEVASRRHAEALLPLLDECCGGHRMEEVDLVAVSRGPGLIGSLLVGVNGAKGLAWGLSRPLVGVHHVEAHLYAAMMGLEDPSAYLPALGVVVSGGHTTLLQVERVGAYHPLGQTVDDAIGEAFDKVAAMLGLGYPGGPVVEELARRGDRDAFPFRGGVVKGSPYLLSFSGLKTAVLYAIRKMGPHIAEETICSVCASFQRAAFDSLIGRIALACGSMPHLKALFLGGGVSQNLVLRERIAREIPLPSFWPAPGLSLDNAVMIAGLGFHQWRAAPRDETFSLAPAARISNWP